MIVRDSSFVIGFYNERDAHHRTASALMARSLADEWGRGLLLEYVFLEVVTVLLQRRDLSVAIRVGRILLGAKELEFVPCSELFQKTMGRFANQVTTRLSFTDAAIAGLALTRAEGQILSFDEEFRKVSGLRVNPE